jgi:hypothetical protein
MAFLSEKRAIVMAAIMTSRNQPWQPKLSCDQIKARRVDELEAVGFRCGRPISTFVAESDKDGAARPSNGQWQLWRRLD